MVGWQEAEQRAKDSSKDSVESTPSSTRSEHHISMKDMLLRGGSHEQEDGEPTENGKHKAKPQETAPSRRAGVRWPS